MIAQPVCSDDPCAVEADKLAPWQARLEDLRTFAEGDRSASNAFGDAHIGIHHECTELENTIRNKWPNPQNIGEETPQWTLYQRSKSELEGLAKRRAIAYSRYVRSSERSRASGRLVSECESWLQSHHTEILCETLALPSDPEPLAETINPRDALNALRAEIALIPGKLSELAKRPATVDELKKAISQEVDFEGAVYAESCAGTLGYSRTRDDVDLALAIPVHGDRTLRGILCFFMPEAVKEKLLSAAVAHCGSERKPISAAGLAEARDKLYADLWRLERSEELLIRVAAMAGEDIPRRADADPSAVLAP